ncbi:MAG: ChbG/HpnK family deacetylase, partial [Alphaproteobacteria bacterium]|nr:ChbG/HpnK family deacetylase [Alphaproteobacteria bacterium]
MPQGTSSGRPFVLCADDYGLSPGVSRGILALIEMGRVSATGCMVTMPH